MIQEMSFGYEGSVVAKLMRMYYESYQIGFDVRRAAVDATELFRKWFDRGLWNHCKRSAFDAHPTQQSELQGQAKLQGELRTLHARPNLITSCINGAPTQEYVEV